MALCHEWSTAVNADPAILSRSVEDGLSVLGYDSVKPEQLAAIKSVFRGEDVFVSVPTGFGKSLMYQILPICARKLLRSCGSTLPADLIPLVVVVSPLIALMQDQVSKLNSGCSGDINAICVSGLSTTDGTALQEYAIGSPETIIGGCSLFRDGHFTRRVVALAIDEAHCVVKW